MKSCSPCLLDVAGYQCRCPDNISFVTGSERCNLPGMLSSVPCGLLSLSFTNVSNISVFCIIREFSTPPQGVITPNFRTTPPRNSSPDTP